MVLIVLIVAVLLGVYLAGKSIGGRREGGNQVILFVNGILQLIKLMIIGMVIVGIFSAFFYS